MVNTTDSHRLAQTKISFNGPKDLNVTIKGSFIDIILKSKLKNDFKVYKNDHLIMLQAGSVTYYSQLMEANYPPVDQLIPTKHVTHLVINDSRGLIDALELAKITLEKEKRVYVTLELIDGESVITTFKGDFKHEIKGYHKLDDLIIDFNPQYLIDALKQLNHKKPAVMQFTSSLRPFTLTQENNDTLHLLVPVRTS